MYWWGFRKTPVLLRSIAPPLSTYPRYSAWQGGSQMSLTPAFGDSLTWCVHVRWDKTIS